MGSKVLLAFWAESFELVELSELLPSSCSAVTFSHLVGEITKA
jgi:hypothetical protein